MIDERFVLLKKALCNPGLVPPFVLGKALPGSQWGPEWRREDDYVTFEEGGFAGGDPSRPEFSARIYYEGDRLRDVLGDARYDRSLEVGCGYGRMTGWIADYAAENVAIEPNEDALADAKRLFPDVEFRSTLASDLDAPDDSFDLVVAWTVFTHVPPDALKASAHELKRVARPDATILLTEHTEGDRGRVAWPRSKAEYESVFDPYEVTAICEDPRGPTYAGNTGMEVFTLEQ
jgi:SAM-dependent methyltransferase